MRNAILLLTAVAIAAAPACSYLTVVGPPPPESANTMYGPPGDGYAVAARPVPRCTDSKLAPIVDTIVAAFYIPSGLAMTGVGAALRLSDNNMPEDDRVIDRHGVGGLLIAIGVVTVLFGLPWALSASSGYRDVNACRAARGY